MDRLTTGRRHVRAGSVHVTELIDKQARRTRLPSPPAAPGQAAPTTPEPDVTPLLDQLAAGPRSRRRPPSRGAQLAKLTGLGAATLALCGAVAAASMISDHRAAQNAADRSALRITDDRALLPDRLDRELADQLDPVPGERPAAPPAGPAPDTATERTGSAPPSTPAAEPAPPTTSAPLPDPPTTAGPVSDVELVEEFYGLLPNDPDAAFGLLSPNLLGTTLGEFLRSWSTVAGIEVIDVREQADGVHAVVRLALADGGRIQLEQLLTAADSPRRITGVQLLSAQRN